MNQDIRDIINKTWDIEAKQIERLKEMIDQAVLEKIIDRIGKCQGRIIITGCGTSAMAARKIAHSLSVIDIPSVFLNPSDAVHGSLGCFADVSTSLDMTEEARHDRGSST